MFVLSGHACKLSTYHHFRKSFVPTSNKILNYAAWGCRSVICVICGCGWLYFNIWNHYYDCSYMCTDFESKTNVPTVIIVSIHNATLYHISSDCNLLYRIVSKIFVQYTYIIQVFLTSVCALKIFKICILPLGLTPVGIIILALCSLWLIPLLMWLLLLCQV